MSRSFRAVIAAVACVIAAPATAGAADAVAIGPPTQTVGEAAGTFSATVTRTGGPLVAGAAVEVTVSLGRTSDTAAVPADVAEASRTVSLPAGVLGMTTSAPVTFALMEDALDEADEIVSAHVTAAPGLQFDPAVYATTTITDNDAAPTVVVGPGSGPEGTGPATTLALPVTLSAPSGQPVSVGYDLAPGTATAADLSLASGTVSVPPGQTTGTIAVPIVADALDEDDEAFSAALKAPVNATLGAPATAAGKITDDDTATLSIANAFGAEGNGVSSLGFPVTLSTPSAKAVTVDYATANQSATAPADFNAASGTLSFAPGETAKEVRVGVVGDVVAEANEVFGLALFAPVNAGLATASALGGILDDDFAAAGPGAPPGGSGGVDGTGIDVTAPKGKLAKVTLRKPGTLRSSFSCPAAEKSCRAQITVFTVAKPRGKVKRLRRELKLVAKTITVAGGRTGTLSAKIPSSALKLLRRAKVTNVRAYAVVRDADGNVGTAQSSGTLRP